MDNIYSKINTLYEKKGYLERYGSSVIISTFIILIFAGYVLYYYFMNHIQPIKSDWTNQRCNPLVIPFAGLINKPTHQSKFDFTGDNFSYCTQTILKDITDVAFQPIYYFVNLISTVTSDLSASINSVRAMMDRMRNDLSSIYSSNVMARILNITVPIIHILVKIKDMMGKFQGIMMASAYIHYLVPIYLLNRY